MTKYSFVYFFSLFISCFAYAEQVTININAKLEASTCSLSAGSLNSSITLNAGYLNNEAIGVPFGQTPFSITIENCPLNVTSIHVKFTGLSDKNMPNLIQTDTKAEGISVGIAIGLYDTNRNNLDIRNNITSFNLDHSAVSNRLEFIAAYVRTSTLSSPGQVTGVTSFEISYD